MKAFIRHAIAKASLFRSIKIALVVGTILALINHYGSIFHGTLTWANIFQIVLTYFVPFGVATYSAAMQAREDESKTSQRKD